MPPPVSNLIPGTLSETFLDAEVMPMSRIELMDNFFMPCIVRFTPSHAYFCRYVASQHLAV